MLMPGGPLLRMAFVTRAAEPDHPTRETWFGGRGKLSSGASGAFSTVLENYP